MGVEQAVDHLAPISVAGDQPEIPQYTELVRDRRLLHPYFGAELTHRALAGTQAVEYPDAAGGREGSHEPRHLFGRLLGQRTTDRRVVRLSHVHMLTCTYKYVKRSPIFFK